MTPLRLLILAVLLYIAYRLIRSLLLQELSKKEHIEKKQTKVEDILVEDPVCHNLVPKSNAVRLRKDKETYYFCSDKCCDIYIKESEEE